LFSAHRVESRDGHVSIDKKVLDRPLRLQDDGRLNT
jgi:hypothetical protein